MEYPGPPPPMAEAGFEPQTRARSNTWPCPRPEDNNNVSHSPGGCGMQGQLNHQDGSELTTTPGGLLLPKKSTSRRNAWGNMSYADLITQAISSSPEKRLTLSQIYDWMVTNVPYFKDKGDSNSSAGWKNSIRHNLSLHNRFVRVQNEGTGKSSWWMLNPDAKPGKAARRRATSMETSKYEKKRGRIRKKIEAMRNGTTVLDTPSPCSSLSEGLDIFPESPQVLHSFQLSPNDFRPNDFRPRASSNASSCGRLSPILGVNETNVDLHDNQVPPMSPWTLDYAYQAQQQNYGSSLGTSGDRFGAEQLAGSLANTMKLSDGCFMPPPPTVPEYTSGFTLTNFQSAQSTPPGSTAAGLNTTSVASDVGATGFRRMAQEPHYYDFIPGGTNEKQHQALHNVHHSELDFTLEHLGPFDCDVDEVLQTELSMGGDILVNDFNFGGGNAGVTALHNGNLVSVASTTSPSLHHPTPTTSYNTGVSSAAVHHQQQVGRQWVH